MSANPDTCTHRAATAVARFDVDRHVNVAGHAGAYRAVERAADRAERHYPGDRRVRAAVITAYLIAWWRGHRTYCQVMHRYDPARRRTA